MPKSAVLYIAANGVQIVNELATNANNPIMYFIRYTLAMAVRIKVTPWIFLMLRFDCSACTSESDLTNKTFSSNLMSERDSVLDVLNQFYVCEPLAVAQSR
jgi:hypothetical protein